MPAIAPRGHPELFTLASSDWRVRQSALTYTAQTIRFAGEFGAKVVIIHCGNVEMRGMSHKLRKLCDNGQRYSNRFERAKMKLVTKREKVVAPQLDNLVAGLERLVPVLEETGIRLGLENLPTWEAIPTETECIRILDKLGTEHFCYWHDIGHGQIRENLGFINHVTELRRLQPYLGGMHVHDVTAITCDHQMPPAGNVDFRALRAFAAGDMLRVLEPSPRLAAVDVARGLQVLREQWSGV